MLKCPECEASYEDGYKTCSDCHVDLVSTDEATLNPSKERVYYDDSEEIVFLTNVQEPFQANYLLDILHSENILVLTKDPEFGGYLKIYLGTSYLGLDFYVNASDYDRAITVIKDIEASVVHVTNTPESQIEIDDEVNSGTTSYTDHYKTKERIIRFVILFFVGVSLASILSFLLI